MRTANLLGLTFGAILIVAASGASAASSNPQPGGQGVALTKLAAAQDTTPGVGHSVPGTQSTLPEPAGPQPRRKRQLYGLPFLAAIAFGAGTAIALTDDQGPDSP
jgi:hypothetical protein